MKEIFAVQFSWLQFFIALALAAIILRTLRFLEMKSKNYLISGKFKLPLKNFLRKFSIVAEPAIIIAVIGVFASIYPVYNGTLLVVLIFIFFVHLKNYFAGKIILFMDELPNNMHISSGKTAGNIVRKGSLGIKIQTDHGQHFLAFSQLLSEGYALHEGKTGRKLTELSVACPDNTVQIQKDSFMDFLASIPYINWTYLPEINDEESDNLIVKILLRDHTSMSDLKKLFAESGYAINVLKKLS